MNAIYSYSIISLLMLGCAPTISIAQNSDNYKWMIEVDGINTWVIKSGFEVDYANQVSLGARSEITYRLCNFGKLSLRIGTHFDWITARSEYQYSQLVPYVQDTALVEMGTLDFKTLSIGVPVILEWYSTLSRILPYATLSIRYRAYDEGQLTFDRIKYYDALFGEVYVERDMPFIYHSDREHDLRGAEATIGLGLRIRPSKNANSRALVSLGCEMTLVPEDYHLDYRFLRMHLGIGYKF